MAGELAAIDSYGAANAINMNPGAYGQSTIDAVNSVTGLGIVVAQNIQLLSTPDGAPFGWVQVPDGYNVQMQGLPPGSSVGWNMESGVSTIYDANGIPIGAMVAPLQPFGSARVIPVQTIPYQWVRAPNGVYVPVIPQGCRLAMVAVRWCGVGHVASTWWGIATGRNYGGPDGGSSNG